MTTLDGLLPGIVDAHVHYFDPTRSSWALARFARIAALPMRRLVPGPILRASARFTDPDERRLLIDPAVLGAAYEPPQYAIDVGNLMASTGVGTEQVVAVESQWRPEPDPEVVMARAAAELTYVTGLPNGTHGPRLGAVVTAADPRHPQFATHLDRQLAESDRVRGVRVKWAQHPDPDLLDWCAEPDFVASTAFLTGFEALADRGLSFVSLAYSHQLGQLDLLARRFPETTIVIDHLGLPAGIFGPTGARTGTTAAARAEIHNLWRERMTMIAQNPNVVVKVSGLGLGVLGYGRETAGNIGSRRVLADMIGPLVLHVVDHFGPDRVMFGSDSPVDKPNAPIGMVAGALLDVLGDRGEHVVTQLFAETARRVYRLDS
ncbi:amidohydrolase family protein [Gordonia shandongensis]|uniref:amidohydrolase family protein n=1 Tax=Gordonia shandongensis TaxID=376351 RepID=UPI0003FEF904|nr:amidohydrolase family protein [Gordonia shandongensis]